MFQPNFHGYHIRKWYSFVEETCATEMGNLVSGTPLCKIIIAAAVLNPYAGRFGENLDLIVESSPLLGAEFGRRICETAGDKAIESYGKACIIGTNGEYEHGNAFLTSIFANPIRDAIGGGAAWVPSTGKRGGPGTLIDVPLAHKDALYVRSHYDTLTAGFSDAPGPNEVVVVFGFATGGRPHARLGGLDSREVEGKDGLH